jgi:hypothetical protein
MANKIDNPLGGNGDYVAAGDQALHGVQHQLSCRRGPVVLRTMFGICDTGPKPADTNATATTAAKKQVQPTRKSLASLSM